MTDPARIPLRSDELEAIRAFVAAGMSLDTISELLGRPHSSVCGAMKRWGIAWPSREDRARLREARRRAREAKGLGKALTNHKQGDRPRVGRAPLSRRKRAALYAGQHYEDDPRVPRREARMSCVPPCSLIEGGASSLGEFG